MALLDGVKVSNSISSALVDIIKTLELKLAIILVGDSPSSVVYVNSKKKKCNSLGVGCEIIHFESNATEEEILRKIEFYNNDATITGILVQLPLPAHVNTRKILDFVDINKDVDGLNSQHLLRMLLNEERIIPCTPKGIITLFDYYKLNLYGKKVCVVGFSNLVGKPLALMCINRGATVTICNSKTKNLKEHTLKSEVIVCSVGKPELITKDMVPKGCIVVDIGITKINGKIYGDVDFDNVKDKCSYITPVPGGVGPMTIISLIENLIFLKNLQNSS